PNRHVFEALLLPKVRDVTRELIVSLRAGGMRLGGQVAMKVPDAFRREHRVETTLGRNLLAGGVGGVPRQLSGRRGVTGSRLLILLSSSRLLVLRLLGRL